MHKNSVRQLQRAIFSQDNAVLTTFGTVVPWWPQNSGCYEFSPQIEDGVSHLIWGPKPMKTQICFMMRSHELGMNWARWHTPLIPVLWCELGASVDNMASSRAVTWHEHKWVSSVFLRDSEQHKDQAKELVCGAMLQKTTAGRWSGKAGKTHRWQTLEIGWNTEQKAGVMLEWGSWATPKHMPFTLSCPHLQRTWETAITAGVLESQQMLGATRKRPRQPCWHLTSGRHLKGSHLSLLLIGTNSGKWHQVYLLAQL